MKLANFLKNAIETRQPPHPPLCDYIMREVAPLLAENNCPHQISVAVITGITLALHQILNHGIPEDLESIAHGEGSLDTYDTLSLEPDQKPDNEGSVC